MTERARTLTMRCCDDDPALVSSSGGGPAPSGGLLSGGWVVSFLAAAMRNPMTTEDQIDQAERRATLENDLKVLQQQRGSTFHQHGLAAANDTGGGRFASLGAPHVVGSTAIPKYPQAGPAFQVDPVPDEPPLSAYENPAIEPSTNQLPPPVAVEDTGPAIGW